MLKELLTKVSLSVVEKRCLQVKGGWAGPLRTVKKQQSDAHRLKHAAKLNYLYEWASLLSILSPGFSLIVLMGPEQCKGSS